MLPSAQRLRQDKDFRRVFRQGRTARARYLNVRVAPGSQKSHRFGFAISTKVAKRATDRNTIKRRLRTAAKSIALPARPSLDIVVTAQPASLTASYRDLLAELQQLLDITHASHRRLPH